MVDIVLSTINAKYIHCAYGLRYLQANLGELEHRSTLVELTLNESPADMAERILAHDPKLVGVGVYIWNAVLARDLVSHLKRIRPEVVVVLGGPEVSHELDTQEIVSLADHVITGDGEVAFAELCRAVLDGEPRPQKVIAGGSVHPSRLQLPYRLYSDEDIAHRVIYVEASRGCPFRCQFCLSALDRGVNAFELDRLLPELEALFARGVRQFKFVDRTFNLNLATSRRLLEFFLPKAQAAQGEGGVFVHFEMIPDRFPEPLREVVQAFPPGTLQFEVGIQTFNPDVAARIERRQDVARTEDNLRWLREATGVHVHADLIIGLPGESLESFAAGFDRLVALGPQEIQVGVLKRLRGAPIAMHDHRQVYSDRPPYEVLRTAELDFATLQRLKRFAKAWDTVNNRGNFIETTPRLWEGTTPFAGFLAFSDWLHRRAGRVHSLALDRLVVFLMEYLTVEKGLSPDHVRETMHRDYARGGRVKLPELLRAPKASKKRSAIPSRQVRHLN